MQANQQMWRKAIYAMRPRDAKRQHSVWRCEIVRGRHIDIHMSSSQPHGYGCLVDFLSRETMYVGGSGIESEHCHQTAPQQ